MSAEKQKWETVAGNTYRLRVPGGWLYRFGGSEFMVRDELPVAMVFVPWPDDPREAAL
jgi:hypothetical protein